MLMRRHRRGWIQPTQTRARITVRPNTRAHHHHQKGCYGVTVIYLLCQPVGPGLRRAAHLPARGLALAWQRCPSVRLHGLGKLWQNVARKNAARHPLDPPAVRSRCSPGRHRRGGAPGHPACPGDLGRKVRERVGGRGSAGRRTAMRSRSEFVRRVRAAHADPKSKAKMGAAARPLVGARGWARRSEPGFGRDQCRNEACAQTPDRVGAALAYRWARRPGKVAAKRALREAAE